ncbi:hypothetical protein PIB30_033686 [Stylosanthes scabra]|uniref:Uncharacterized protein n=1 Tax=Stylosanthes scabra TaxID=79078 RepID=A0ABU6WB08_9FABA|nr:hypothetical protein [Stylosanthes scabra]
MIGAGKNGPPGKYERWLSGASTGPVDIRVKFRELVPYWEPHEFCGSHSVVVEMFQMQVEPSCSHLLLVLLLRIGTVDALSSTGSDLSWVVEAWGVTYWDGNPNRLCCEQGRFSSKEELSQKLATSSKIPSMELGSFSQRVNAMVDFGCEKIKSCNCVCEQRLKRD